MCVHMQASVRGSIGRDKASRARMPAGTDAHVCMYVHTRMHVDLSASARPPIMHARVYISCVCAYIYIYIHIYIYIYIYIYVDIYIYIYICRYIYIVRGAEACVHALSTGAHA